MLARTVREETEFAEPSVVIAQRPCVLTDFYQATPPFRVVDEACTGCSNCFNVGCPAIHLSRSEQKTLASGAVTELQFAVIDPIACTGCGLCERACGPQAIVATAPADGSAAGAAAAPRC